MRRIVWGCALMLTCLPLAVAQRGDAAKHTRSKTKESAQADSSKPKTQPGDAKPDEAKPGGDKPAGDGEGFGAAGGRRRRGGFGEGRGEGAEKEQRTIYDYQLPGPDGKAIPMSEFKGKVILLVNLARNSSYNDQLAGLQKLSDEFKDKGLVVIGVPCNDFGAAEPGTDAEIQKAYADAKVTFPIMARSLLLGEEELPLYQFLTKGSSGDSAGGGGGGRGGGGGGARGGGGGSESGDVHWNFTKFLIDRNGKTVARMDPDVTPDSLEMQATLDKVFDSSSDRPQRGGPRRGGQPQEQHQPPKNNTTASAKEPNI